MTIDNDVNGVPNQNRRGVASGKSGRSQNVMEDIKAQIFEMRRIKPRRDQLGDFLLGLHRRLTPNGRENWNWAGHPIE